MLTRFFPRRLDAYMAASAQASSSSRLAPWAGKLATPILTVSGLGSAEVIAATLLAQRVGRREGVLLSQPGQQSAELLAADPEHGVTAPGAAAQGIGHQAQRLITDLMAVEIVDLLEVVDVEQQDAEGIGGGQLGGQLLVEHPVAEQAGQGVVASLLLALLVEQRFVDRELAETDEMQQHLVGLGAGRRRAGDRDHRRPSRRRP